MRNASVRIEGMPSKPSPSKVAAEIRAILKRDGSAEHAKGVQWFFKEDVKSHGWYTAALRTFARQRRREIMREDGFEFLVLVADKLFTGCILEEKIFGVLLLENLTG